MDPGEYFSTMTTSLANLDFSDPTATTDENYNIRREVCTNCCNRPINVCLCNDLPSQPILTSTQIIILRHPHELRHKLATAPLLTKCLLNCRTIVGRRLRVGSSAILDSLHRAAIQNPNQSRRSIYLFPSVTDSSPSIEINEWKSFNSNKELDTGLVLIVFDGTWRHAKEMVSASSQFLSEFAVNVYLDFDARVSGGTIYDSDLVLRKEPFGGCVSTIEAVARSLRVLEPEPHGAEVEGRLLMVLRAMVRFQACNLKPLKPRPKLLRKNGKKVEEKNKSLELSGNMLMAKRKHLFWWPVSLIA